MVIVHRRNRLGNVLFQYCFGRVLAQRFGYRLAAVPLPDFPGTKATVAGDEIFGPFTRWQGQWPFDSFVSRPIVKAELFNPPGARLALDGWFQRFEFIADVRDDIREDWLRLRNPLPPRPPGDFAICLRLTDYALTSREERSVSADPLAGSFFLEDEIRHLARIVSYQQLFIVTDQPGHSLIDSVRDLRPQIISGEPMDDFRFIHSCQKVAISQSTFHWWATFLGVAKEIYFPHTGRGMWSKPEPAVSICDPAHYGVDLRVREPRYIYDWAAA